MILSIEHDILVSDPDISTAEQHVRLFFEKSQLVHYDSIEFDRSRSMNATDPHFGEEIEKAIAENRKILLELLGKLEAEGYEKLQDLQELTQGFQSKLLHTMSHLLDGFFGIDSKFYDIDEITHWVSDTRQKQISESPESCWLIRVKARSVYGQGFEKESD